jgi:D-aspartate ligase
VIDATVPAVVAFRGAYGAVSIARTLGRLGVPTYLVAQDGKSSPVTSSRYWAERMWWNFDRSEEDSVGYLIEVGKRLAARHGRPALLLTMEDWMAVLFERNGDALREQFIVPLPDQPVVHTLLNKWGMNELARENGIPIPTTIFPASGAEAEDFLATAGLPVVMKGADPFAPDRPPTMIIRRPEELLEVISKREATGKSLNMVLQEFIPGGIDSVWMCNGYFGADPARGLTFPGRKLRQMSAAGIASLAVCEPNETVASQTRRLMQGVGYRGCCGIGWRYDKRDGRYKLLDVNARVSGIFRLFVGTNEVDVVRACYLDLTGQTIPQTALQPGRKWMLEDDILPATAGVRSGQLTLREWARSLRGVRELHWWAADDPLPGLQWSSSRIRMLTSSVFNRAQKEA